MIDPGQLHLIELLLSIAGFLILFLLGIIGFWIQKWIRATDALTEVIQKLEIHFASTQTTVEDIKKQCDTRCSQYDKRLNSHSEVIHTHSTDIAVLKQHHK
ncbi:MAG: hypothetical protein WC865_17705 [Bacteroidales bacterium]